MLLCCSPVASYNAVASLHDDILYHVLTRHVPHVFEMLWRIITKEGKAHLFHRCISFGK